MRSFLARAIALVFLAVVASPLTHAARVTAPAWLTTLAAQPAGMDYGDAHHVVLLDEATLDVDKTGVITRRVRYAVAYSPRRPRTPLSPDSPTRPAPIK